MQNLLNIYRPTSLLLRKEFLVHQSGVPGKAVPKLQGNRYVLMNVIERGYLTAIYCRNIPAFLTL